MPNQRGRTQRLVNFPASDEFIAEMDAALPVAGYSNRSEFIRDAVEEKLKRAGVKLSAGAKCAPPRAGKKRPSPIGISPIEQSEHPGMTLDPAVKNLVDQIVRDHPEPDSNPPAKAPRRAPQRGAD